MKETETKKQDKIEIVKQSKKDIQRILVGSVKPQKNHTIFEVNLVENTIVKATFDRDFIFGQKNKSVSKKENCIYISALNKKNVLKILKRDYETIP